MTRESYWSANNPAIRRISPVGRSSGPQELLDRAVAAAGLARGAVYVTYVVKHFNFKPRGKFRLHKRPPATAIKACRPWLDAELEALRPTPRGLERIRSQLVQAVGSESESGSEFQALGSQ